MKNSALKNQYIIPALLLGFQAVSTAPATAATLSPIHEQEAAGQKADRDSALEHFKSAIIPAMSLEAARFCKTHHLDDLKKDGKEPTKAEISNWVSNIYKDTGDLLAILAHPPEKESALTTIDILKKVEALHSKGVILLTGYLNPTLMQQQMAVAYPPEEDTRAVRLNNLMQMNANRDELVQVVYKLFDEVYAQDAPTPLNSVAVFVKYAGHSSKVEVTHLTPETAFPELDGMVIDTGVPTSPCNSHDYTKLSRAEPLYASLDCHPL